MFVPFFMAFIDVTNYINSTKSMLSANLNNIGEPFPAITNFMLLYVPQNINVPDENTIEYHIVHNKFQYGSIDNIVYMKIVCTYLDISVNNVNDFVIFTNNKTDFVLESFVDYYGSIYDQKSIMLLMKKAHSMPVSIEDINIAYILAEVSSLEQNIFKRHIILYKLTDDDARRLYVTDSYVITCNLPFWPQINLS